MLMRSESSSITKPYWRAYSAPRPYPALIIWAFRLQGFGPWDRCYFAPVLRLSDWKSDGCLDVLASPLTQSPRHTVMQ